MKLTQQDKKDIKDALKDALTWEKETEIGFEEDMSEHLKEIKKLERLIELFS